MRDDALPGVIGARCTVVAFASDDEAMSERADDAPERIGPLTALPSGELPLVGCPADGLDGDLHELLLRSSQAAGSPSPWTRCL